MEITLNITNICNLRCTYCIFVGKGSLAPISIEYVDGLSNLINLYTKRGERTSLTFSGGGEPLLVFNELKLIIKNLKIYNIQLLDIFIISNGTIYSNDISEFINKNNIGLTLSLDGSKENHDINRILGITKQGTFELIEQNGLTLFNDVSTVNYTIYHNNFNMLVHSVGYIYKNFTKLKRINFNFVFNIPNWNNATLIKLKKEFDSFIDFYISSKLYQKFETNLGFFSYYETPDAENSCINHLYINRDGDIYKCGAYEFNIRGEPLGNLLTTDSILVDEDRKKMVNCSTRCKEPKFFIKNKKLSIILWYIGKRYNKILPYVPINIRRFHY